MLHIHIVFDSTPILIHFDFESVYKLTPIFDTILLERTVSKIGVDLYTDSKSKCIKNWS